MLMIDFEKLQIIDIDDYMTVNIILDWNSSFLDEPVSVFTKSLNQKVEYELDQHLFKKPVLFHFITRLEEDDLDLITNNLVDSIVYYLTGGPRTREDGNRLGVPESLSNVLMLDGTMETCINNRLDTDVFTIKILDRYGKEFFSVTEVAENAQEVFIEFKEE
jgi:hypothetical protein